MSDRLGGLARLHLALQKMDKTKLNMSEDDRRRVDTYLEKNKITMLLHSH